MFDAMDIQEELNSQVEFWDSAMPQNLREMRANAIRDLNYGPVYLDSEGEAVSCFDAGARRFDFAGACAALSEWSDQIEDIQMESHYCEETDESQYESIDGSRDQIMRALFGELLPYM